MSENSRSNESHRRGGDRRVNSGATGVEASEEARKLALAIAAAGLDKKASAIEIIDVADKVDYTELLVLMSGRSDRHVHAIARGIEEDLRKQQGAVPLSVEGTTTAQWMLLDYNDVVVHVFLQSTRTYYDIEGLWIDAERINVPEPQNRHEGADDEA